jgi:predicted P-loop ATPase
LPPSNQVTDPAAVEVLARRRWGEPNHALSTRDELRFGTNGSKSVKLREGVWFDHETGEGGSFRELGRKANGSDKGSFRLPSGMQRQLGNPVAWWDYHNANGAVVGRVVRFQLDGKGKTFRQCRPDGTRWAWKMDRLQLPLYRLSSLLSAPRDSQVYLTEGEKHADQLREWGLIATTNAGGAGKFRPDHARALAGLRVTVLGDNDPAGREHVAKVLNELALTGVEAREVVLPGLPPKGDVMDWIKAGGTADKLAALTAEVWRTKAEPRGAAAWLPDCIKDHNGQPLPILANVATALRSDPDLKNLLVYDEMARLILITKPMLMPVQDHFVSGLQERLQRAGLPRIGTDVTHQAVEMRARECGFHPVRDYLERLRWDGAPRLNAWLSFYLGAEQSLYTANIGRWFAIAMVARIIRPGCKCDYMLILEGEQGAGKSSACQILAGKWFSDSLPDLYQGDAVRLSTHVRNKWLIEIGELSSIGRAHADALKAFLTQTDERYLPKYGRTEVIEPRQCLFIGTTNKTAYLRDETGGRRFWPVKVGAIDLEALRRDRDQLFAEAMVALRAGEQWWPDRAFEAQYIQPEQDARYEADPWETVIAEYLASAEETTVIDVARHALFMDTPKVGTTEQRRITAVMERIGWIRGTRTKKGRPWVRSDQAAANGKAAAVDGP